MRYNDQSCGGVGCCVGENTTPYSLLHLNQGTHMSPAIIIMGTQTINYKNMAPTTRTTRKNRIM